MARLPPRRTSAGISWAAIGGFALIILALLAIGGLLSFSYYSPKPRVLDANSLCPLSGPDGVIVILVDTSDDLPPSTKQEARTIVDDIITKLPPFYRLDIRVLDIAGQKSTSLFSKCNPGDGNGLSDWTNNPRLAKLKWLEGFQKPAADAINSSFTSQKAQSSPIMGAIQDIAIGRFSGSAVESAEKQLVIISDMLEFSRDYSQYPRAGDLSYQRFRQSPAYLKVRTDLHGARVTIHYVQRVQPKIDNLKHAEFWHQWVLDNRGTWDKLHRLQGAN